MQAHYDHSFKLTLVGDDKVGKTALLTRLIDKKFPTDFYSTIGVDFKTTTLQENQKIFKLQIWDTSGNPRFSAITTSYYRGSSVIILAFDLTNKTSFKNLNNYLTEIKKYATSNVKIILIGTKADEADEIENRKVFSEEIDEFKNNYNNSSVSHKIEQYIETSAKTGLNVDHVFQTATQLYKNTLAKPTNAVPIDNELSDNQKATFIHNLDNYINRIEKNRDNNGNINFSHGFWFFKESRAKNREANYLLARELKAKLEKNEPLIDTLVKIETLRSDLASNQGLFSKQNPNRGINSSELNNVIKEAKSYLKVKK